MTPSQIIQDKLKKILVERFAIDPAKIQLNTDLQKELNLDSMDAIDLLLAVNETFGIQLPEQSLEKIHTVGDLVEHIEKFTPFEKGGR